MGSTYWSPHYRTEDDLSAGGSRKDSGSSMHERFRAREDHPGRRSRDARGPPESQRRYCNESRTAQPRRIETATRSRSCDRRLARRSLGGFSKWRWSSRLPVLRQWITGSVQLVLSEFRQRGGLRL